jgi:CheY-like chemotaxis protein
MDRAARVLIVDEDPDHLNILATLLAHHHYRVAVETAPEDGFTTAMRDRPDAVLMGLHFGGVPAGLELIDRLRAQPATASIPILVVSSFTDMHDGELRERGIRRVPKGGHLAQIVDELKSLLAAG